MRIVFAPLALGLCGAVALTGCAALQKDSAHAPSVSLIEVDKDWQRFATPEDTERLIALASDWKDGLAAIKPGRATREKEAEGVLFDPAAALPAPAPPPGNYRCRVWRLPAANARGGTAIIGFKPFDCYIGTDQNVLTFTKQTGSDRPAGRIWPDEDNRLVFLGTMVKGREQIIPAYGDDASRNLIGIVERVAPFRWRMVLPRPVAESRLDVIEMVPYVTPLSGDVPA